MRVDEHVQAGKEGYARLDPSQEGDKVNFDVGDLGGHFDTTFSKLVCYTCCKVNFVITRLLLVVVLPLNFHGEASGSSHYVHPWCTPWC